MDEPHPSRVKLSRRRNLLDTAGMFAAVAALTVIVLRWMGRSWWCHCGNPIPWSGDIWSEHNSQHGFDPYSWTHLLHGVLLCGATRWLLPNLSAHRRFRLVVVLEACWEILENSPIIIERYREATISLDYFGDSIANSLADILMCAIGFALATRIRWWWSALVVIAVELWLLATIRDCLALNILMLIYPLESIKQWQVS